VPEPVQLPQMMGSKFLVVEIKWLCLSLRDPLKTGESIFAGAIKLSVQPPKTWVADF